MSKKIKLILVAFFGLAIVAGAAVYLHKRPGGLAGLFKKTPSIVGELKVLTYAPQGENLPISTEGVTVMFNHAVVPLTTLDSGRDQAIPLQIMPATEGKFFWLGTHGFIFRPAKPFEPATSYQIDLPAGVVSVDGYKLDQPLSWKFSTVRPRVTSPETSNKNDVTQTVLPKNPFIDLEFNISMNPTDVESKLEFANAAEEKISVKSKFVWSEENHRLRIQIENDLPWGEKFQIRLPEGVRANRGDLGTASLFSAAFETPAKELKLDSVEAMSASEGQIISLTPEKESVVQFDSQVCFSFNQMIEKKSFEKAFHGAFAEKGPGKKFQVSFDFQDYGTFDTLDEQGKPSLLEGYSRGCASFLNDYNQAYTLSVDLKQIRSLSGAVSQQNPVTYRLKTDHAYAQVNTPIKKTLLSQQGPLTIPYQGVNLKSAKFRLFKWSKSTDYDGNLRNRKVDLERIRNPDSSGLVEIGYSQVYAPIDPKTKIIDSTRLKPDLTQNIVIPSSKNDVPFSFEVNLANLPDSFAADHRLPSGIYLVEVIGEPSLNTPLPKDIYQHPLTSYTMIQVSRVGLAMKRELDHTLLWATDIETGAPLANLPIDLTYYPNYDKESQGVSAQATTQSDGVAMLATPASEVNNVCAQVIQPGMEAFACERDMELTGYNYPLTKGLHYFAYLYTDRPIYRPGQEVHFSSFLRQVREGRYFMIKPGESVDVRVTDAAGKEIFKEKISIETGGIVGGKFTLENSDEIPRGHYSLNLKLGKQSFTREFQVASYRKPSFKVDLKTENPELISSDELKASVQGNYFFGAPMRKAKVEWSIMTGTYLFAPSGYEEFSFVDPDELYRKGSDDENFESVRYESEYEYDTVASYAMSEDQDHESFSQGPSTRGPSSDFLNDDHGKPLSLKPATLDDQGNLLIQYKPNLKKYPTSQTLTIEANVKDPANQEVSGAETVIVHKANFYLGLRPQKWVYGSKENAQLDLVSLDTQGKAAGAKAYAVEVYRREYQMIQKHLPSGNWDLIYAPKDTKLTVLNGTTDSSGKATLSFPIDQGGQYRFVAKGKDEKGNDIQAATDIYAWGEGYVPWRLDETAKIEMVPDKSSYQVGEKAKILIKSLVPVTKALLTYERGRVLEYKVVELGGGNASHLEIPITEGMIPNFYLSVIAHAGREAPSGGAGKGRPPMLFYGETELHIEPESKRLNVTILPNRPAQGDQPAIYRPGDEVKVHLKVQDATGKAVKSHLMVSVADESVLRLLNYPLPDLVKQFYYRRPNHVISSSLLKLLKAGDGGENPASMKRRVFKDTADFEKHLVTNENGEVDFSFKLPDDLTTWVIEALAISESKTFEAFETDRKAAAASRPAGQVAVGSDLILSDHNLVGSNRAKIMTTRPVVLRAALPRFAVWGDEIRGQIVANNRNPQPVQGKIRLTLSGDAIFSNDQAMQEFPINIPASTEKAYPVQMKIRSAEGRLAFSAEALDDQGNLLDGLETSLPVQDRFAPEVVASSGVVQDPQHEKIDLPSNITPDRGGVDLTLKASLALAAAPSLKHLIDYPYACSEQKSAALLAILFTGQLTDQLGESFFDSIAPFRQEELKNTQGLEAKKALLHERAQKLTTELVKKYQDPTGGGIRYWPESRDPDYFASVQTLWALTTAQRQGAEVDQTALNKLESYIRARLYSHTPYSLTPDEKAYGLWSLSLASDNTLDFANLDQEVQNMSVSGLSYLLMAMKNASSTADGSEVYKRLLSLSKQEPRHTSWPSSGFFSSTATKNTALASWALLNHDPKDPLIPRGLAFLLNRKTAGCFFCTQDPLYTSGMIVQYSKISQEGETQFKASVALGGKTLLTQNFDREHLFAVRSEKIAMKDLLSQKMPIDLQLSKEGAGTLYYDMVLKYYLSPDQTPTREEGLILSREYYELNDTKEEKPLTEFKVGENYKGHMVLVVPQDMNYVVVQDLLPSGFEPIDMTLAISSAALQLKSNEHPEESEGFQTDDSEEYENARFILRSHSYDDVLVPEDYGMNFGFTHQEVRDDLILWSDRFLPAGVYHIRYPVRATTAGRYLMPGAMAFEFYEPEIFARSRTRIAEIKE